MHAWLWTALTLAIGSLQGAAFAALSLVAVLLGGIGTLVVVLLWLKLFPELVRFATLHPWVTPA